jgi:hypothetical protein
LTNGELQAIPAGIATFSYFIRQSYPR